jgi:nucleotide-binding universal stress UspA family protein
MIRGVSAGEKVKSVVIHSSPKNEILNFARSSGFDLILMGTHGREGLSQIFLGSVAEHVIRHTQCPVYVISDKAEKAQAAPVTMEEAVLN